MNKAIQKSFGYILFLISIITSFYVQDNVWKFSILAILLVLAIAARLHSNKSILNTNKSINYMFLVFIVVMVIITIYDLYHP